MFARPITWRWPSLLAVAIYASGCGAPVAAPPAPVAGESLAGQTAGETRPAVRLLVECDDGQECHVDILNLTSAELQKLSQLDERQRAAAARVGVVTDAAGELPPIGGTWVVAGKALRFTPRFPLGSDLQLRVIVQRSQLGAAGAAPAEDVVLEFATPAAQPAEAHEIVHVYPSSNRLPENQLKFYIHFSAPMSRGEAYRHVHLLDGQGRELEDVFLELGEELWDPAMRRFTLLCDPGRVKRGLRPREELGTVLEAGRDYTLVISRDWPDAAGRQLARDVTKKFHVLPADESPIDPATWTIAAPPAGTSDALCVRFPESLDHALLERLISVTNSADQRLSGSVEVTEDETCWRFSPAQPWAAGEYRLLVDDALEDLAGNSLGRAFDVDLQGAAAPSSPTGGVALPFSIPPSSPAP